MCDTWTGDWTDRVRAVVRSMGYEDTFTFVTLQPGKSFGELFGMLRNAAAAQHISVAFAQLPEMFYKDAEQRQCVREALMEALVRSLQHYVWHGWNRGKASRRRRLDARQHWHIPSDNFEQWLELQEKAWLELALLAPHDEWCPHGIDDPIIQEVFSRVWPENGHSA